MIFQKGRVRYVCGQKVLRSNILFGTEKVRYSEMVVMNEKCWFGLVRCANAVITIEVCKTWKDKEDCVCPVHDGDRIFKHKW